MLDLHSDEENEVQTAGKMKSFPTIETRDQLVDAITMCIHIASPQHTAVNYLQYVYQVFIPAKPPALYTPLPKSLAELKKITETDLLRALPVGRQRDWLLAAHVPWLLSFKTAEESSLTKYAKSLWNLVRKKSGMKNDMTKAIAEQFYLDLRDLIKRFKDNSDKMTEGTIPYVVMDPESTAVSILI